MTLRQQMKIPLKAVVYFPEDRKPMTLSSTRLLCMAQKKKVGSLVDVMWETCPERANKAEILFMNGELTSVILNELTTELH